MIRRLSLLSLAVIALGYVLNFAIEPSRAAPDEAVAPTAEEMVLARVPVISLEEAQKTFEVADGFRLELAAHEPMIVDPVAMAFDEAGRLYVVDMIDYSERDQDRLGRVRLLTDTDGDGQFDTSSIFLDNLSWPTAITCFDGGVFVGDAPDIHYAKDTNGDGVADEQRVVYTGFGRSNVQGLFNSFHWGLDHRIYGQTSSSGGQITRPGVAGEPLDLRGRDFAFDPKTLEISAVTGGAQHGMSFNRWGDRFVCSNSDHLQAIVFEERYLSRNPFQPVSSARRSIAVDGPQAAVYRSSPIEAWRIARTKMRVAGLAKGPIEGGGTPAGYFTGATGTTIYEGGLWGGDEPGWAIVADVGSNLIHRKRMVPDGVTYRGERIDVENEFVRSTDLWFRPVQFAIGPEGALYVADMYREVIEHPQSLPPELKSQLDLNSGNDRGRIYRIVPSDYYYKRHKSLAGVPTRELVAALDEPNLWRRTTALRLIYEQQDPAAAPLLRAQLKTGKRPEGRVCIHYALASVGALTPDDVLVGLSDSHPQVRRQAVRLSEPLLNTSPAVRDKVIALATDENSLVQFQLALSLGECDDPRAAEALATVVDRSVEDGDIVDAALTSLNKKAGATLKALLSKSSWISKPQAKGVLAALVRQIVRQQQEAEVEVLVAALKSSNDNSHADGAAAILKALSKLHADVFASKGSPALAKLQQLREEAAVKIAQAARQTLEQDSTPLEQRLSAIENLSLDTFEHQRSLLEKLLSPGQPPEVRAAVLAACADYDDPAVAQLVLARWSQFTPAERTQATELLLRREAWALELLSSFAKEGVSLSSIDPTYVTKLQNYPSEKVRATARSLAGQGIAEDRRKIFQEYRAATALAGDPVQGKEIFTKNCSACHEMEGAGKAVGPNLAAMVSRGADSVLFNVLVPNGEVDPRFTEYVLLTTDGQVLTGVIAGETSNAVTLRGAEGKTNTVLRVDVEELKSTGKSLMPEGFEKTIDQQAMADLLTYLRQAATPGGNGK